MTKLNSLFVANVKTPGRYYDGNGLYLLVQKNTVSGIRKSWVLRFASPITRKRRDLGLGGMTSVGLAEVRKKAVQIRSEIQSGADPLGKSTHHRILIRCDQDTSPEASFEVLARNFHSTHSLTLKNEKYRQQWINNLERYLFRDLGDTSIEQIKASHLATLLQPLAIRIPDTTRKIIGQLDLIFRDCLARDLIAKNEIDKLKLIIKYERKPRKHFLALNWQEAPALYKLVQSTSDLLETTRNAFCFGMLTAGRTSEVMYLKWAEINLDESVWKVPAERMKAGLAHQVHLCKAARALLVKQSLQNQKNEDSDFVFPSNRSRNGCLSDNAFTAVISSIGFDKKTTYHGLCRATFSTWARENNIAEPAVIEACLAHSNGNKVERAYDRSKHLSARENLLEAWAKFLEGTS